LAILILPLAAVFLFAQWVFVDHRAQYPWEAEATALGTLEMPSRDYHLSLFGFPYQRLWPEVGAYLAAQDAKGFVTNENSTIYQFYVPVPAMSVEEADFYVQVFAPQSFSEPMDNPVIEALVNGGEPEKVFMDEGRTWAAVFRIP
jgi:hypothetical protein